MGGVVARGRRQRPRQRYTQKMTEECKICDKEYAIITMSHIKTHDMTKEEYDAYGTVDPIEQEAVGEPMWESLDTSSIEYKTKRARLMSNQKALNNNMNVKVGDHRNCPVCVERIYEPHAYVRLRSRLEQTNRRIQNEQTVMHLECVIAVASIRDQIASVYIAPM